MLSPLEMLDRLEDLLGDPKTWVQNRIAANQFGNECSPCDESACRWCVFGGVYHILSGPPPDLHFEELNRCAQNRGFRDCADLNDNTDHETVLDLIRAAKAGLTTEEA